MYTYNTLESPHKVTLTDDSVDDLMVLLLKRRSVLPDGRTPQCLYAKTTLQTFVCSDNMTQHNLNVTQVEILIFEKCSRPKTVV